MATNLAIDDKLINEAKAVGHHKTKKEAVTTALERYVQWHKQQEILKHFGTIDYDPDYDYKRNRMLDKIEIDEPEAQA
jgi:recombination DNA repair RAD52 pathway protein